VQRQCVNTESRFFCVWPGPWCYITWVLCNVRIIPSHLAHVRKQSVTCWVSTGYWGWYRWIQESCSVGWPSWYNLISVLKGAFIWLTNIEASGEIPVKITLFGKVLYGALTEIKTFYFIFARKIQKKLLPLRQESHLCPKLNNITIIYNITIIVVASKTTNLEDRLMHWAGRP